MSSVALSQFLNKLTTENVKINPRHDFDFDETNFVAFYPSDSKIKMIIASLGFSSYFIQNFNIPDYDVTDDNTIETMLSKSASHMLILTPSSNTFTMSIINTNKFFIESIFYPWIEELKSPKWNYDEMPYTTAKFKLKMANSSMLYVFYGCRPTELELYKPTQELVSTMTRDVTFTFDYMKIIDTNNSFNSKPKIEIVTAQKREELFNKNIEQLDNITADSASSSEFRRKGNKNPEYTEKPLLNSLTGETITLDGPKVTDKSKMVINSSEILSPTTESTSSSTPNMDPDI